MCLLGGHRRVHWLGRASGSNTGAVLRPANDETEISKQARVKLEKQLEPQTKAVLLLALKAWWI